MTHDDWLSEQLKIYKRERDQFKAENEQLKEQLDKLKQELINLFLKHY